MTSTALKTKPSEVAALHAQGKRVICYIDVGTAENFRPDYSSFPKSVLGHSNGWPGEKWLDIRRLVGARADHDRALSDVPRKGLRRGRAGQHGSVSPTSRGSRSPPGSSSTYNEWVAGEVHSLGMAVLQKNDGEQAAEQQPYFDGVLDEQCNQYHECADFQPYLAAGKPVLNAEYHLADEEVLRRR